jgi:hypothetical protein
MDRNRNLAGFAEEQMVEEEIFQTAGTIAVPRSNRPKHEITGSIRSDLILKEK